MTSKEDTILADNRILKGNGKFDPLRDRKAHEGMKV